MELNFGIEDLPRLSFMRVIEVWQSSEPGTAFHESARQEFLKRLDDEGSGTYVKATSKPY